jgi:ribosomal protein S18 acetylase RimI-like enzyme
VVRQGAETALRPRQDFATFPGMHAFHQPTPHAAARPAIDLRCRRLAPRHVHDLVGFLTRLADAGDGRLFHPHPFTCQAVEPLAAPGRGDEYHVLTAGRDGPVVAYGMLRGWEEGYTVPSLGIAVDAQWRGQGIGRRLVTHLHVIAAARGAGTVRLKVYRSNEAAIALYRSFGYEFRPLSEEQWLGLLNLAAAPARMAA